MVLLINHASASAALPIVAVLWLVLAVCPASIIAGESANEYTIKAAVLYKFASFVVWPESNPSAPLVIGVMGEDPFGPVLDQIVMDKNVNGRKFEIHRFRAGQDPDQVQILFIGETDRRRLRAVLGRLRGAAVLTVADMPGFCENGGMIRLGLENNHVSLEINPDAAESAGLQFSSKLLSLARIVRPPRSVE